MVASDTLPDAVRRLSYRVKIDIIEWSRERTFERQKKLECV